MLEEKVSNKNQTQNQGARMTSYHASLDNFKGDRQEKRVHPKSQNGRNTAGKKRGENHLDKVYKSNQVNQKVTFRGSKTLKIAHLGGLEEVGRNMAILEYGNDILVVDAGFGFPSDDMLGVDYVIPDVTYLQENKSRIKGIVLTHGHMDHIGAIPYIIEKIGSPTIYGTNLSIGILKEKFEEFGLSSKVKTVVVNPEKDNLSLGVFKVGFFRVNHNIPDTVGLVIETPVGKVVHTADFKFDLTPINEPVIDLGRIAEIGKGGVLALMMDSTGARNSGYAISESEIKDNLKDLFDRTKGRIFISSFSTLISRIQQIIDVTASSNRKLSITGRSMLSTIEVAGKLGYLKVPEGLIVTPLAGSKLPDDKIAILSTGTQGEDSSALTRMSRGEHKFFKIRKGDTVILSSSIIPGNEAKVVEVYDNLLKAGAKVVDYKQMDIHTSGHAHQEELKTMIRLISPKYFIPVHGNRYMRQANADLAKAMGYEEETLFVVENGEVIEFTDSKASVLQSQIPTSYVLVDGLGVGDVGNIVLRDRQAMAEGGIFCIILTVDRRTSEIVTSPDIISRGFVYMRAAESLIHRARSEVRNIFKRHTMEGKPADWSYMKSILREEMGEFLFKETKRRPMIIPVIIEV
ncbi:MAG: Ribonuclease J 1 [candidate division WS2 bacterium ADurb.Bin280]|uniref:Ribonuclease J n=1 Tax=candidate division WS2 bacterium ADurb.Bin280 TaxID=1852829 RepID=A0A1V5SD39_9BACT|nr:MAG: Ribonuclease J 1 [candidate division WS2 bacterium ADurb.Bin280]